MLVVAYKQEEKKKYVGGILLKNSKGLMKGVSKDIFFWFMD